MELHAQIRQEDGSYWAQVAELPGCFASGRSLDELAEALNEAISLCLEEESGSPVARPPQINEFKVLV